MRNNDRIVFDAAQGQVRYDMTREKDRHAVAFRDLARLELRRQEDGFGSDRKVLYRLFLVKKDGATCWWTRRRASSR